MNLFPPRTQWENRDLSAAEENPWAEDYRNPKETSVPIPIEALCTDFPRIWLGLYGNTLIFSKYAVTNAWPGWRKQSCMGWVVQKPRYMFTKGEKTPARLASWENRIALYDLLLVKLLWSGGVGTKHCIAYFTLVELCGVLVSIILFWNLLVLVISPVTCWWHCSLLGYLYGKLKSWQG